MAAELSAATYRLFANAMNGYGRTGAEQHYLNQAQRAFENPLATRPGGTHLNFNQGQNGPRFDYNSQIANRYPNTWGRPNPGDNTRAAGWQPQVSPAVQHAPTQWAPQSGWAPGMVPQITQWSSQGQMAPAMAPDRIGGDPRMQAPIQPTPQTYFSPAQLQNIQMGNSRTWGPGTSPYAGLGNYPVTAQGMPAPGNPAYGYSTMNGGWGGLPK